MGERRLVALLTEPLSINWACVSINISPLRGFPDGLLKRGVNEIKTESELRSRNLSEPRSDLSPLSRLSPRAISSEFECMRRSFSDLWKDKLADTPWPN
jgi:hypothetical protein